MITEGLFLVTNGTRTPVTDFGKAPVVYQPTAAVPVIAPSRVLAETTVTGLVTSSLAPGYQWPSYL